MKRLGVIRSLIASALIAAYGGMAAAQVAESEQNSPISSAQLLTVDTNGTVTVTALFSTGDVDFYSFEGTTGNKVTIKVEGGGPTIDTIMTFLGPNEFGPQQALTSNDDCVSGVVIDPCVASFELKSDGVYFVAVTHFPTLVADNGVLLDYSGSNPLTGGSYTLTVSGVSPKVVEAPPTVQQVRIDVRPGKRAETATVHLARAEIPVAILSSEDFDAMQVDTNTLRFGHSGNEQSLMKCFPKGMDVNRDGRRDMICLFSIQAADFEPNDLAGFVKGSTRTGTQFEGQGLLKVVDIKKGRRHRGYSHDWHNGRRDRGDDRWHRGDRDDDDDRKRHRR
jgi:hypothetical protein